MSVNDDALDLGAPENPTFADPAEKPQDDAGKVSDPGPSTVSENEPKVIGTQDLYNVNDGIHGRSGGPYLDEVEALAFERLQAAREGSEPNYDQPRVGPGVPLVSKESLVANYNPTLIAGDELRTGEFQAKPYATDVPIVAPTGPDFSYTDENRGDAADPVVGPLEDNPAESNVSVAFAKANL